MMKHVIAFFYAINVYLFLNNDLLAMNELPFEKTPKIRLIMAKTAYKQKLIEPKNKK